MSIFASRTTQTILLPSDATQTATIRKLSGRQLQAARDAWTAAASAAFRALGGEAFRQEIAAVGDPAETAARVAELQADPLYGLDRSVLILKGVVALSEVPDYGTWTAGQKTDWYEDELSDEDAVGLARAVAQLTVPARDAVARKNG